MTDENGYATYGKDSNGHGILPFGNSYILKEQVSGGFAIIYDASGNVIQNAPKLKPKYVSSSSNVAIRIANVGE